MKRDELEKIIADELYDFLYRLHAIKNPTSKKNIKKYFQQNLSKDDYIESILKYLEIKKKEDIEYLELANELILKIKRYQNLKGVFKD